MRLYIKTERYLLFRNTVAVWPLGQSLIYVQCGEIIHLSLVCGLLVTPKQKPPVGGADGFSWKHKKFGQL
jgi:hypothetical protein